MKFLVVAIGKSKFPFVDGALAHYREAIGHFTEIEMLELKDQAANPEQEEKIVLEALTRRKILGDGKNRVFLLDEKGKEQGSVEFATQLKKLEDQGVSRAVFVIGGAYGFRDELRRQFPAVSLSKMTFPHDLVRVFLLEQIYRALHIQSGGKYHHE